MEESTGWTFDTDGASTRSSEQNGGATEFSRSGSGIIVILATKSFTEEGNKKIGWVMGRSEVFMCVVNCIIYLDRNLNVHGYRAIFMDRFGMGRLIYLLVEGPLVKAVAHNLQRYLA